MGLFNIFKGKHKDRHHDSNSREHSRDGESVSEQQQLNEEKRDMIRGIEELAETSVKEVMIPRIDVDFLSCGTPQDELLEKIAESAYRIAAIIRGSGKVSETVADSARIFLKRYIMYLGNKSRASIGSCQRKADILFGTKARKSILPFPNFSGSLKYLNTFTVT